MAACVQAAAAAGKRRTEDLVHPLTFSLEELYSGVTKKLSLSKDVLCYTCDG